MISLEEKQKILKTFNKYFTSTVQVVVDEGGLVNCGGSVMMRKPCENFPVKFGTVSGSFNCDEVELKSLVGAPTHVGKHFNCNGNHLENLEGGPNEVGGSYHCNHMTLKSLKGLAENIGEAIWVKYHPELPLLRTLVAKRGVILWEINKYIPEGSLVEGTMSEFKGQGKRGFLAATIALLKLEKQLQEKYPSNNINLRENIKW